MTKRKIVELRNNGEKRYCVIGPRMAVDFHFTAINGYDTVAGLECHYKQQPSYLAGQEPFDEQCWLTGVRCWGDGTSLYATEYLLPLFQSLGVEAFWPFLEEEHRRRDRDAFGEPVSVDAVRLSVGEPGVSTRENDSSSSSSSSTQGAPAPTEGPQ
jgi:hypothetical protein